MSEPRIPLIDLHLTPFAPGIPHDAPLSDPLRTRLHFYRTPTEALTDLLARLGRTAAEIEARPMALGDTVILSARQGETRQPLAFVSEHVDPPTVIAALERLAS